MDMPQLWILMDNSSRVTHRPHNCLDNAKAALPTYPQPRLPINLFLFKRKGDKKLEIPKHYTFTIKFKAFNIAIYLLELIRTFHLTITPLLKAAKLPDIRLYDLRHSCATLLLSAGENPKVVSERLGHASVTLTLDTYSHVLPDMQKAATDKLESMLFAGRHAKKDVSTL